MGTWYGFVNPEIIRIMLLSAKVSQVGNEKQMTVGGGDGKPANVEVVESDGARVKLSSSVESKLTEHYVRLDEYFAEHWFTDHVTGEIVNTITGFVVELNLDEEQRGLVLSQVFAKLNSIAEDKGKSEYDKYMTDLKSSVKTCVDLNYADLSWLHAV